MRSIQDIYNTYKIPPNLQLHMYQVTAFGLYIADHLHPDIPVDRDLITKTNLLHDMGNIIKFNFDVHAQMGISAKDIPYWKNVQSEFIEKYGKDEDVATDLIVKELGVEQEVRDILSQHGIVKVKIALEQDDWNTKIVRLSDERISPQGVVTLHERYQDLLLRYGGKNHELGDNDYISKRRKYMEALEQQIQEKCTIDIQTICNADIEPFIASFPNYEI